MAPPEYKSDDPLIDRLQIVVPDRPYKVDKISIVNYYTDSHCIGYKYFCNGRQTTSSFYFKLMDKFDKDYWLPLRSKTNQHLCSKSFGLENLNVEKSEVEKLIKKVLSSLTST